MILGFATGLTLQALFPANTWIEQNITQGILTAISNMFMSCLKMIVAPLVLFSLICGLSSLSDSSKIGRLSIKTIFTYIFTTALAISIAISISNFIEPGIALTKTIETKKNIGSLNMMEILQSIIPDNIIEALAEGKMLQIIFFATLFGIALAKTDNENKLKPVFFSINDVILKIVGFIMMLAPIGVFAIMAKLALTVGIKTFEGIAYYFLTVILALMIQIFIVYPVILKVFSGLSIRSFFRKIKSVQLVAFTTSSSNATLPLTMKTAENNMGVKKEISSFTLPLGATINMDGTAIMQGVATVFIAQTYQQDLSISDYVTVVIMATLASLGTAGVPSAGIVTLAMVVKQVNLPTEGIALIIGVDRLLDMLRTSVNVTGDSVVTLIIAKSEKCIDIKQYNSKQEQKT